MREFVSRTLLPRLEERISRLNAAITATRRGLRNRLNRFWKGAAEDRQNDRWGATLERQHTNNFRQESLRKAGIGVG